MLLQYSVVLSGICVFQGVLVEESVIECTVTLLCNVLYYYSVLLKDMFYYYIGINTLHPLQFN